MNRIRELRTESNLTLKKLASILGVAESTVSLYETGKHEPDIAMIIKIADYFRVSTDYLLCRQVTYQDKLAVTMDEEEMIDLFRKIGQKHGKEGQQYALSTMKNLLNIKK